MSTGPGDDLPGAGGAAGAGEAASSALLHRAVAGLGWVFTSMIAARVITFLSTIVLARVLAPDDFGILAIPLLLNTYLDTLGDLGTGAALVRQEKDIEKAALVTLGFNVALQFCWFGLTWLSAGRVAEYFGRPEAAEAIRALAWIFPIEALGNVHEALLLHDLSFRRRAVPEITRALVKGLASVAIALVRPDIWALVWGQLIGTVAWVFAQWLAVRWRPWEHLDRDSLQRAKASIKPMLAFGSQVVLVNVLAGALHHVDKLVVGRYAGVTALGLYIMATKLPEALITTLTWAVGRVAFPAFARAAEQGVERAAMYLGALRLITVATLPMAAGLAVLAAPVVLVAFGAKWLGAAAMLRWLALGAAFRALGSHAGDLFKGAGRADLLRNLGLVKACITLPAVLGAAFLTHRAEAIAMALAAATLLTSAMNVAAACWILDMRPRAVLRELVPGVVTAAGVAAVAIAAGPATAWLPPPVAASLRVALAGAAFVLLAWRLTPELGAIARGLASRGRQAVAASLARGRAS